jgi:DNA-binding MarR family transcriptional regulator
LDAELRAANDLPPFSFDVLFQRAPTPGGRVHLSELATRVLMTLNGISRLVDRLECEGLLRQVSDPEDQRSYFAALTGKGDARLCRDQRMYVTVVWSTTALRAPVPIPARR